MLALIVMSINDPDTDYLWAIIGISCLLGIVLVLPIGGADMPVVVSLLAHSVAAAFTGFIIRILSSLWQVLWSVPQVSS